MRAYRAGNAGIEAATVLLNNRTDLGAEDRFNKTVLDWAGKNEKLKALLKENGAIK